MRPKKRNFKSCLKDKKAFTLVEILIVIVILSVLAVIAVPRLINNSRRFQIAEAMTILDNAAEQSHREFDMTRQFGTAHASVSLPPPKNGLSYILTNCGHDKSDPFDPEGGEESRWRCGYAVETSPGVRVFGMKIYDDGTSRGYVKRDHPLYEIARSVLPARYVSCNNVEC